jgi:hypothetical protein
MFYFFKACCGRWIHKYLHTCSECGKASIQNEHVCEECMEERVIPQARSREHSLASVEGLVTEGPLRI